MKANKIDFYQGAPKPDNEAERLFALRSLEIDSNPDADFDHIALMAKDIFDTPIGIVSFVDADTQWFKACPGIDIKETPREYAFCAFTILQDDVIVVPDATLDPRFMNNPLVMGPPHVRFYAGTPLYAPGGEKIGTICVVDMKPRPDFTPRDAKILSGLASIISRMLLVKKEKSQSDLSNAAKTEFLSHISHELRTPLNALIGIANLLRQKKDFDDKTSQMIRALHITSESLLELINSVLDLSAIEARNFELTQETFSWDEMFDEMEAILGTKAREKGLGFFLDTDCVKGKSFRGDRLRVKQLLINILGNAVKFTERGKISLDTRCHNGMLEIKISDTGVGISPEKIVEVFHPFVQAHKNDGQFQGTGLGLAIARELAEKMDGSIHVESTPGKGSAFTIRLPDTTVAGNTKKSPSSDETGKDEMKNDVMILLAEDYPANVLITSHFLNDFGFGFEVAEDGQQVLQMMLDKKYDIILMDINMPQVSGIEATKLLRANHKFQNIPIIGMSAHVFEKERLLCMEAGMNDYVTKPINYSELNNKIRALLNLDAA